MATKGYENITEAELAAHGKGIVRGSVNSVTTTHGLEGATMPAKPSKYRNVKTVVDGIRFDSKRESDYWMGLRAREQAGEITELARQVRFPLYCPEFDAEGNVIPGNCLQVAEYVADFTYKLDGLLMVVDAKARRISPYPLKRKWLQLQSGIDIIEV